MTKNLVAKGSVVIKAPSARVWDALVNPKTIKQYMFGTNVESDWKIGSPIFFRGEWQGRKYEDKGMILRLEPGRLLEYSHFSPLSGLPDVPENYHTVTIELSEQKNEVLVSLAQDNNLTEQERRHSEQNWSNMLADLKKIVEHG